MDWIEGPERGEWLRERIDAQWTQASRMHMVVPRGYEAYARVLHPVSRSRPADGLDWPAPGESWPGPMIDNHFENELSTWARIAELRGTTLHALAQWAPLATVPLHTGFDLVDDERWRYSPPEEGSLGAAAFARLVHALTEFTATPDALTAALWDGWGSLRGGSSIAVLTISAFEDGESSDTVIPRAEAISQEALRQERWNVDNPHLVPAEVQHAGTLDLPNRSYWLAAATSAELSGERWPERAPWVRRIPEHGVLSVDSPSILWPEDRAWVLVTEVDFDSTVIAGSRAMVQAIQEMEGVEAFEIPADADLSWTGDTVNPAVER